MPLHRSSAIVSMMSAVLLALGACRELLGRGSLGADLGLLFGGSHAGGGWQVFPESRGLLIALLPPEAIGEPHQQAENRERSRDEQRIAQHLLDQVAEQEPDDADRDRGIEQAEALPTEVELAHCQLDDQHRQWRAAEVEPGGDQRACSISAD